MGIEARVVNVALGKAHAVALTDTGQVYTFGINNKGQCGRDGSVFLSSSQPKPPGGKPPRTIPTAPSNYVDPDASTDTGSQSEDGGSAPEAKLCPAGEHHWTLDQCMICTQCHQCTGMSELILEFNFISFSLQLFFLFLFAGFGNTCVNTNSPGRSPGK